MKTGFFDKSGKPVYIGDIVQYRLNLGSAVQLEVVKTKQGIRLLNPNRTQPSSSGIPLQKKYEQYISIVDTSHRSK